VLILAGADCVEELDVVLVGDNDLVELEVPEADFEPCADAEEVVDEETDFDGSLVVVAVLEAVDVREVDSEEVAVLVGSGVTLKKDEAEAVLDGASVLVEVILGFTEIDESAVTVGTEVANDVLVPVDVLVADLEAVAVKVGRTAVSSKPLGPTSEINTSDVSPA